MPCKAKYWHTLSHQQYFSTPHFLDTCPWVFNEKIYIELAQGDTKLFFLLLFIQGINFGKNLLNLLINIVGAFKYMWKLNSFYLGETVQELWIQLHLEKRKSKSFIFYRLNLDVEIYLGNHKTKIQITVN